MKPEIGRVQIVCDNSPLTHKLKIGLDIDTYITRYISLSVGVITALILLGCSWINQSKAESIS